MRSERTSVWTIEGGFQPIGGSSPEALPRAAQRRAGRRALVEQRRQRTQREVARAFKRLQLRLRVVRVVFAAQLTLAAMGTLGDRAVVPVAIVLAVPTALAWTYTELEAWTARREKRQAAKARRLRQTPAR